MFTLVILKIISIFNGIFFIKWLIKFFEKSRQLIKMRIYHEFLNKMVNFQTVKISIFSSKKNKIFITSQIKKIVFVVSFLTIYFSGFKIYSQDSGEQGTKFNLTGTMRFRAFGLSRDTPTTRLTSSAFTNDIAGTYNTLTQAYYDNLLTDYNRTLLGQNRLRSKRKESLNYMDSRLFLNMDFITSQYFDGVVGITVGDIPFGGRGLSPSGNNTNILDSYTQGPGSGGETGQAIPINIQTSLLYLNFRMRNYNFLSRFGVQLFSSPQGRVFFATGAGILMNKDFKEDKFSIEGGWIRTRERSIADLDNNGFNDKRRNINVLFAKIKIYKVNNMKNEIYSYTSLDNDNSDVNREVGNLFWHGIFNEFTLSSFNFIAHGVINHGKVSTVNSIVDKDADIIIQKQTKYNINGALGDLQATYFYNNKLNFNAIVIGTTGRPGYDKDGVESSYKNSGYRTLSPGFAISNLGIDFTGGYALFNARNMSGLVEYGSFANYILGPVQLTFGYYQLHASRAPRLSVNREYNSLLNRSSSTYLGDEFNFNLRWNVFIDFQILFRSGIFFPKNGIRALYDFNGGSFLQEAFVSGEYKF